VLRKITSTIVPLTVEARIVIVGSCTIAVIEDSRGLVEVDIIDWPDEHLDCCSYLINSYYCSYYH
jgi:hypothetical protein